ncbi:membrane protein insertase YidC [Trichothermofontia sichuanensis B231]|uniref:membrane protein insertase YidC n=1 Tax=Trichothermofontia sichuanensis TaxID=3045816 RepID=UPI00224719FF|nr:membrane protein insertase YidC [Trichothermofontia sichuanensis]UZQ56166.1 membrane protein insertase YidC [Trichothermofontia sichuanensis B231]
MDFGVGFLSNNVMLPILDFFYGIVPSYGLAIVALTLVVRFALYPLNAGQIRNMRRMKVTQPLMQKRMKEIQERYSNDPVKQREEVSKLYKEFGNPLAGCLPLLIQMPVLFALFATLRGSPFSDVNYTVNLQIFPQEQIEQIQPQVYATKPQNIYVADGDHAAIVALLPGGNRLAVGQKTRVEFQSVAGTPLPELVAAHSEADITPQWKVIKGEERVRIDPDGTIVALQPGEVTLQGTVPGLAANKGFLFIKALGRVGAVQEDGTINWDIVAMVLAFGVSMYINQLLSGQGGGTGNPQQDSINKVMPVLFSGMFLFFPLPAGVLLYMLIANIFQTLQTFILSREPLPEEIQKLVDLEARNTKAAKGESNGNKNSADRKTLPFEPKSVVAKPTPNKPAKSAKKSQPKSSK